MWLGWGEVGLFNFGMMRVFVVEDECWIVIGFKCGFEVDGFSVDLVFIGDDGIWYVIELSYDVIVLDLMFLGWLGFLVCN